MQKISLRWLLQKQKATQRRLYKLYVKIIISHRNFTSIFLKPLFIAQQIGVKLF
jgi:hypothetical protein